MLEPGELTEAVALRENIAVRLDTQSLPIAGEQKIFGGYGCDQICTCCDRHIRATEVLYEIELDPEQRSMVLAMHRRCFDIWMEESMSRRRR